MKNLILITATILILMEPLAGGAFLFRNKRNNSSFKTARAKKQDVSSSVLATGSVEPMVGAEVKVGARISGKVEHLYFNIGDRVKKGQIIAEIEKRDLEARVAQKEAELKAKEAGIGKSKASLWPRVNAETDYGFKDTQFPPQERDAFAGLKVTMPLFSGQDIYNIKQSRSYKEAARAALEYAKIQLSYATIRAPISGVIASVSTQEGETVSAGLNAPTFVTIIDLNRLEVDAFVDETDIGKVKVGQKAVFTVDAYPNKEFEGIVRAIYPKAVIQDNVVNYDVVININSPFKNLLRPDMTTSVSIYQKKRKGVLMVPQKAVKREGGNKFVMVKMPDGVLQRKIIKTGIRKGRNIEIISGLNEGDVVVYNKGNAGGQV